MKSLLLSSEHNLHNARFYKVGLIELHNRPGPLSQVDHLNKSSVPQIHQKSGTKEAVRPPLQPSSI